MKTRYLLLGRQLGFLGPMSVLCTSTLSTLSLGRRSEIASDQCGIQSGNRKPGNRSDHNIQVEKLFPAGWSTACDSIPQALCGSQTSLNPEVRSKEKAVRSTGRCFRAVRWEEEKKGRKRQDPYRDHACRRIPVTLSRLFIYYTYEYDISNQ